MKEYEVCVESMTPCGGSKYANRGFEEIEAESPRAYVESVKRFDILDEYIDDKGDTVIITGNEAGYRDIYTFTE